LFLRGRRLYEDRKLRVLKFAAAYFN
jgi:hypothetical protein